MKPQRATVPIVLISMLGIAGWQLGPTISNYCGRFDVNQQQPKALIDLGVSDLVVAQFRWALLFAVVGGLPFVVRQIRRRKSPDLRTVAGVGFGIGVTALSILAAITIAWIRVLFLPATTTNVDEDIGRIYFFLHGCGFQTGFASIAIVACLAVWVHAAKAESKRS